MIRREPDLLRKFSPLTKDHPMVGAETCPGCKKVFKEGDYITLVAIGPGDDPEEREKALAGHVYNAVAVPVHWECAGGRNEDVL